MKITKKQLKQLIKEELTASMEGQQRPVEKNVDWLAISKILEQAGVGLRNPHQWLRDGLSSGVVTKLSDW